MNFPPFTLQSQPWSDQQAQKLADDDVRRLHLIRAACRSLRDELHGCDWFSSVAHDSEYRTIFVNTVNLENHECHTLIRRWCGFPIQYRQQP